MTDKQIIIDGIDVSGCDYYKNNYKCRIPHYQQNVKYTCCNCSEWNCYYKQLARKEQECEKLKKECEIWKNQVLTIDDETITVQITQQQFEEYNQLKVENEELKKYKKVVDKLAGMQVILTNEEKMPMLYENAKDLKLKQLSKILTEIKEIAKYDVYTTRTDLCLKLNWIKKKISECEVQDAKTN